MKRFLGLLACVAGVLPVSAAVISISGTIDGDAVLGPEDGDTLDYLTFEVLSPGIVVLNSATDSTVRYLLAEFIGREDVFGDLSTTGPFRLVWDCLGPACRDSPPMILSRHLEPGVYVVIALERFRTSYDHFDGYVPVNLEGGGFSFDLYNYTLEGDIRGIEFREGNLDGTFTFTRIPEPGAVALLGIAWATLLPRRRRKARILESCSWGGVVQ